MVSKLTYALASSCLNVAEKRRLNGFHNRCVRKIWGIQPAFYSRVSNARVLATAQQKPLTHMIAKQQLLLYGKAARAPTESVLRDSCLCPNSLRSATDRYARRVGRPRKEWVPEAHKLAIQLFGSSRAVDDIIYSEAMWRQHVEQRMSRASPA